MTDRLADRLVENGVEYRIVGASGRGLFEPVAHGLVVEPAGRRRWRHHCCRYEIWEEQLLVETLFVATAGCPPAVEHHAPERAIAPDPLVAGGGFNYVYRGLNLAVPFDGRLLLARDLDRDVAVHPDIEPAWKYREVEELQFEYGAVVDRIDRSDDAASMRSWLARGAADDRQAARRPAVTWVDHGTGVEYRW